MTILEARSSLFLLCTSVLFALGCASARGPLFEPTQYSTERLQASAGTVVIVDKRAEVAASRTFDTPFISSPGTDRRAQLPLHPDLNRHLQSVVDRLLGSAPRQLEFRVYVLTAMGGWKSTWTSETEMTRVELEVEIFSVGDERYLAKATGSAWGELTSMDAKDDGPARLLDRALVAAFEMAVARASSVRTINDAIEARGRAAGTP